MIIRFGKHKGKDTSELPDSYLTWLNEESYIYYKNKRLHSAVVNEIKERADAPEISATDIAIIRVNKYIDYTRKNTELSACKLIESWYN